MSFGYNTKRERSRQEDYRETKETNTNGRVSHLESFVSNEITENIPKNTSDLFESQSGSKTDPPLRESQSSNLTIFLVLVFYCSLRSHKDRDQIIYETIISNNKYKMDMFKQAMMEVCAQEQPK